jgi:sarcosine oxidase subunit gamma
VTADDLVPIDLAQIDVRAARDLLPFAAPVENAASTWSDHDVLGLGPDEWLVVAAPEAAPAIVRELEDALSGHHRSILDVSANRTVFEVVDGLEALSSGCGLDLDPTRWRPGMCAQTLFGMAQVILHQRNDRTARVFVRPSFERYVIDRLAAIRVS